MDIDTANNYFDYCMRIMSLKDDDVHVFRNVFEKMNVEHRNSETFKNKLTKTLPDIKSVKILELFFEYGADPNGKKCGCPVLMSTCLIYSLDQENKARHVKLIDTFLKHGADPYTKHPFSGKSVIDICNDNSELEYQLEAINKYLHVEA